MTRLVDKFRINEGNLAERRAFVRLGEEDRSRLAELFQYPRGKSTGGTVIQHVPAHHDHLHVRFRCPPAARPARAAPPRRARAQTPSSG